MCGIFSLFNSHQTPKQLIELIKSLLFMRGEKRGPEYHTLNFYPNNEIHPNLYCMLGFHRLAINGLDEISHQPIHLNNKVLICNGEIYNYRQIYKELNITPNTNSDCESIIHLYEKYGIERTLQLLDGVFAFVLIDYTDIDKIRMFVARDPHGVRPLYTYYIDTDETDTTNETYIPFGFTSEMKMILDTHTSNNVSIHQFTPGTCSAYVLSKDNETDIYWRPLTEYIHYYSTFTHCAGTSAIVSKKTAYQTICESLKQAVKKRVETTDRPIACLLSGGLDSSLITALVHTYYSNSKQGRILETYSIGMEGSEDLRYARMVADYLGTKHTELIVTEEDFLQAIPEVIYAIESYDTTTVRASVGNYLISKYISQHSDAKVIFNGDGSDEVCGGYMYFHYAPNPTEFDYECRRLLNDISYFDVLRSDRSISSNGLEPRTPFLDKSFVQQYLLISKELRFNTHMKHCEKFLLRKAFDEMKLLPYQVLWRTKEAFSDGVSKHSRSWYQIIQDFVSTQDIDENIMTFINPPTTKEQIYYRSIFHKHFGYRHDYIIPYFWMPNFIPNATDASARTLDIYSSKINQNVFDTVIDDSITDSECDEVNYNIGDEASSYTTRDSYS